MRLHIFLVIFMSILISCNGNKIISEKQFTEIYHDSLLKAHPGTKFTIISDLNINGAHKEGLLKISLQNAYNDYKAQPDSIKPIISRYMRSSKEALHTEDSLTKDKIVPVIKSNSYLADVAKSLQLKEDQSTNIVYETYNDKLVVLYAIDRNNSIQYLTTSMLEKSGIQKDSLLPMAIRNLKAALPQVQIQGGEGVFMMIAGGNYETSLILFDALWNKKTLPVDGKFVIAIPSRDVLLITGSNNSEGIKKIKDAALKYSQGNYSVVPDLFVRENNKFQVLK